MSLYAETVDRLTGQLYPHSHLVAQAIQAKDHMEMRYAENISLDDIAKAATVSKFHLIRLFRKMYGRTPNQYLISVRIRAAKKLLQEGMPPTDVCYAVGFTSASTFTGLFKKMTGMTPAIYRQRKAILKKAVNE